MATSISTLEEALIRINELELENAQLKEELAILQSRNLGGRKKHNDAWMQAYNDFAIKYEGGMTLVEIVAEGEISRRTAYRYKAYYEELKKETSKSCQAETLPSKKPISCKK